MPYIRTYLSFPPPLSGIHLVINPLGAFWIVVCLGKKRDTIVQLRTPPHIEILDDLVGEDQLFCWAHVTSWMWAQGVRETTYVHQWDIWDMFILKKLPPESPKTHLMKIVWFPEAWPSVQTTIQSLTKMGHKGFPHHHHELSHVCPSRGAGLPIPDTPQYSIQALADR